MIGYSVNPEFVFAGRVTVAPDGSFAGVGTAHVPAPGSEGSVSPEIVTVPLTLGGAIASGLVEGELPELVVGIYGEQDTPVGLASTVTGSFAGDELFAAAGEFHVITSPNGATLAVVSAPDLLDSAIGTVGLDGRADLVSVSGYGLALAIDPGRRSLSAVLSPPVAAARRYVGLEDTAVRANRLLNMSTRSLVGTGSQVPIAGLVIGGTVPKTVLIRAIGPGLSPYVPPQERDGLLADPAFEVFGKVDGADTSLATNDDWHADPDDVAAIRGAEAVTGAFALPDDSADAALLISLAPGTYTVVARGGAGTTGVALVEVYELPAVPVPATRLVNLSTRGVVGGDAAVMIGGFVVQGNSPKRVLVRGIGPGIAPYLPEDERPLVLADPQLRLVDVTGTTVAVCDDWEEAGTGELVAAAALSVGAFDLPDGSKDAAMVVTLPPGSYTALLSGVGTTAGIGIVEVYELP
jgi:hypothetical protein